MKTWIMIVAFTATSALAQGQGPNTGCPQGLQHRTPEQVLEDQRSWLAAGQFQLAGCNYADDAVVITDGGVITGRATIVQQLTGLGQFFGGAVPMVNEEVVVSILNGNTYMARILFSIDTPCVDIPDGTDMYIIKRGRIQAQTAHGFPVFQCGPPPGP
jgi:hypothetical protein